jgi:hypothetical protein
MMQKRNLPLCLQYIFVSKIDIEYKHSISTITIINLNVENECTEMAQVSVAPIPQENHVWMQCDMVNVQNACVNSTKHRSM